MLKRFLAGTAATLALSLTSVGFGQGLTGTGTASSADALFSQGLQDRTGWENWFSSLNGDEHSGAEYWAGQRSLPDPGDCLGTPDFAKGCNEAKSRLTGPDVLRKSQPDYRAGWNSYAATAAPAAVEPHPGTPTSSEAALPTVPPVPGSSPTAATPAPVQPPSSPPPVTQQAQVKAQQETPGNNPAAAKAANVLNNNDIIEAVKAYTYDRPRFDRDYKGKMFSDLMVFDAADENAFIPDDYFMVFKPKGATHPAASVTCRTHDPSVVKEVLNWNKGQQALVMGTIKEVQVGVHLNPEDCKFVAK